jgi:hypothetical protein
MEIPEQEGCLVALARLFFGMTLLIAAVIILL